MIRTSIVAILLTCFLASTPYCQPKILVVGSSAIDAGTVYNTGSHIIRTFQIENAGDQPLRINQVRTSCGCTAALLSDSVVKPGLKSEIKVDFNPSGYSGDVTKYIYVMSNDPRDQMTTLQLKMNITYAIHSSPTFIIFENAKVGKADTISVTLTNTSDEDFRISKVETNSSVISAQVDKKFLKSGENARLVLYLIAQKIGALAGEFSIRTTSKFQPTLLIRYYAGVN